MKLNYFAARLAVAEGEKVISTNVAEKSSPAVERACKTIAYWLRPYRDVQWSDLLAIVGTAMREAHYTSTACFHEKHDLCRHACKYCAEACGCSCHAVRSEGQLR